MKLNVKTLLIIILLILFPFKSYSTEIIAYLDIDFIFKNSSFGKKIILNLNEENKKNLLELRKKEKELLRIENDLMNKKNILSKVEFDKKYRDLNINIQSFRKMKNDLLIEFEKKKNNEIKIFFKKVNPILEKYMSDNSIKILIDKKNVLIAKDSLDITKNINNLINQELNQ